jgi:hypothetical protein
LNGPWRFLPLIAALALGLLGWSVQGSVERSMRTQLRENLGTVLDAHVEALELWIDRNLRAAEVLAGLPDVQSAAGMLLTRHERAGNDRTELLACPGAQLLRETLQAPVQALGFEGALVFSVEGVMLAGDHPELVGVRIADPTDELFGRVVAGESLVSRPEFPRLILTDETGAPLPQTPIMYAGTPIRGPSGEVLAVLGLRIDPDKDFTRILSVAQTGSTGETYAVDEEGLLISRSRFEDELRRIGLLPRLHGTSSILNVEVRDPGVNLLSGGSPKAELSEQPLTRMAASVTAGEDADDVVGYRDYRGVTVVGAWRWLEDQGFGVATEMDVREAFAPLIFLRKTFYVLFALLVVAAVGFLLASHSNVALRRQMRRAMHELEQLGQYVLEEKIGEGGMGEVFLARHVFLRRPTAVKLLSPQKTSAENIKRFEREVRMTCRLAHPNTIAIYDYGHTDEGVFYYAMEYVPGITLARMVALGGPLPEGRVIHILRQVCGSLREAHETGLIHRDIKPGNLMVARLRAREGDARGRRRHVDAALQPGRDHRDAAVPRARVGRRRRARRPPSGHLLGRGRGLLPAVRARRLRGPLRDRARASARQPRAGPALGEGRPPDRPGPRGGAHALPREEARGPPADGGGPGPRPPLLPGRRHLERGGGARLVGAARGRGEPAGGPRADHPRAGGRRGQPGLRGRETPSRDPFSSSVISGPTADAVGARAPRTPRSGAAEPVATGRATL